MARGPRVIGPAGDVAEGPTLAMRDVSLRYAGAASTAIEDVSLVAQPGQVIAVVGRSGSGKSTLARLVTGQLRPTRGVIHVCGLDTTAVAPTVVAGRAGLVFQNPDHQLFARSVADELRLGPQHAGVSGPETDDRVREAASALQLEDVLGAHPAMLSMGLRKRVAVAAVLTMRPRLLVIDEPTTGRDAREAGWVADVVRTFAASGGAGVVVSHDLALVASIASRVLVLAAGRVTAAGPPGVILADEVLLAAAGLEPPPLVRLALALDLGTGGTAPLTIDEVERALRARLGWRPQP
jgi:energy-coupling factor transport system ATP-binding protein